MCTSFAVYFQDPIYAMNIDHPDRERKFRITHVNCDQNCSDREKCANCALYKNTLIRFHCQNRENNRFLDSACMNSVGMFSNYQFLVPNQKMHISKPKSNKISIGNLFAQSQIYVGAIAELLNRIGKKTIYYNNSFGAFRLHNLFADKEGGALIVEASEQGNAISSIHDQCIVMTNFPVYEFEGKPYSEVYGDGSDRYKVAYQEIMKNQHHFGIEQAFDVLKKTQHPLNIFQPCVLWYLIPFGYMCILCFLEGLKEYGGFLWSKISSNRMLGLKKPINLESGRRAFLHQN